MFLEIWICLLKLGLGFENNPVCLDPGYNKNQAQVTGPHDIDATEVILTLRSICRLSATRSGPRLA